MAGHEFEPWRREGPVNDPLAERVGQRWEALIRQSKEAVASLREATAEAEQQLSQRESAGSTESLGAGHARLSRRLDEFEHRLARIEEALSRPSVPETERADADSPPAGPHPLKLPPQQHAA